MAFSNFSSNSCVVGFHFTKILHLLPSWGHEMLQMDLTIDCSCPECQSPGNEEGRWVHSLRGVLLGFSGAVCLPDLNELDLGFGFLLCIKWIFKSIDFAGLCLGFRKWAMYSKHVLHFLSSRSNVSYCITVSQWSLFLLLRCLLCWICHRKQGILSVLSVWSWNQLRLSREILVSLRVCLGHDCTTFLFSESEPTDLAGEKFKSDRWESAIFLSPTVRLRTSATRSGKSAVLGSNYKAVSRANFLLNCMLHS